MPVTKLFLSSASHLWIAMVFLVTFLAQGGVAREEESNSLEKLAKALQIPGSPPQKRDQAVLEAVGEISAPLDCWKAASLGDWREFHPDGSLALADREAKNKLLGKFREGLSKAAQAATQEENDSLLELVMTICKEERLSVGDKPFSAVCAQVLHQNFWKGDLDIRVARIRAYGILCPPQAEGLKVFSTLIADQELRIRRAAMDGLAYWIEAVGPGRESRDNTSVSRLKAQAHLCMQVLPISKQTLSNESPEIRKRGVAQVMISCLCLVAMISDPNGKVPLDAVDNRAQDIKDERILAEKLGTVIDSLRPQVLTLLRDADMETRLHAHEVVEAMALGRKAWKSQAAAHGLSEGEKYAIQLTMVPRELGISLGDSNYRVRRIAMDTLELLGSDSLQVTPKIISALDDSDRFVRWAAVRALGEMGAPVRENAIPKLTQMMQDQDGDVRKAAVHAVSRLKSK